MYSLAYGMMVQVLRQLKYSGEFEANVASHAALKEGGRVILVVQNGNVISCFISDKYGQKLYHDAEAHRLLSTFGVLDWKRASTNLGNATHSASSGNIMTPPSMPVINRTA